jgi:hypothetical protein
MYNISSIGMVTPTEIEGFGQETPQLAPTFQLKQPVLMGRAPILSAERAAELKAMQEAKRAQEEAALMAAMAAAAAAQEPKGLPTWAWALIGVGGAGVVLAGMYFLFFRKKGRGTAGEVETEIETEVATESLPPTAADTLTGLGSDWARHLRR